MHQYPLTKLSDEENPFGFYPNGSRNSAYRCERCGTVYSEAFPTEMSREPCAPDNETGAGEGY